MPAPWSAAISIGRLHCQCQSHQVLGSRRHQPLPTEGLARLRANSATPNTGCKLLFPSYVLSMCGETLPVIPRWATRFSLAYSFRKADRASWESSRLQGDASACLPPCMPHNQCNCKAKAPGRSRYQIPRARERKIWWAAWTHQDVWLWWMTAL